MSRKNGINMREEFIDFIKDKPSIKCVLLLFDNTTEPIQFILKVDYTSADWERFIRAIDFNYDNGYGTQYLFGNIWFIDNTWATRYENSGSEHWIYNSLPKIPNELMN